MKSSPLKSTILVFIIFWIALYIALPGNFKIFGTNFNRPVLEVKLFSKIFKPNMDLKLGLDLAGGSHLVFEAKTEGISEGDKKEALESATDIISQRVNLFGVSEPSVHLSSFEGKDRIIVELPGISDSSQAIALIGQTARLDFREYKNKELEAEVPTIENTVTTGLTGADFKKAAPGFDTQSGQPIVSFTIKPGDSSKRFSDITTKLKGRPLAIFLDDTVISWPTVQETISEEGQISGNFSVEGAKNFSRLLNAGALPVNLKLIEERTVGASLGADSIKRSIYAGVVGLIAVFVFMLLNYRGLGVVASIGLCIFGVLSLAIYKLIPIVLTLPGIAGFLLSVGMAVDSNILIFERFKEERLKRNIKDALEVSFGRAWDSIRDANVATLLTAFILANPLDFQFLHTSGPVRGFAITLTLGIFISLFTGIVVTRNLLRLFVKPNRN